LTLSGQSVANVLFLTVCNTLSDTLTFRSLSILESQFSKHHGARSFYGAKAIEGLSYSGIDEILVSHLPEMKTCPKVNVIRQSHLTNLSAAENGFMLIL
jgi:hypothetical protein